MKGLEVLIVLGLTCISQVKSDPLSEKLNLLSEKVPEELIQISDPDLKTKEIAVSIFKTLVDRAKNINVYYILARSNDVFKENKELVTQCNKEINNIFNKLNKSILDDKTMFYVLNMYMQLRYYFEYNDRLLDFSVKADTVDAFNEKLESEILNELEALFQFLSVETLKVKYDENNESLFRNVLIDRTLDVYRVMLEVFPFLYSATNTNTIRRTDVANLLLKRVTENLQSTIADLKNTPGLQAIDISAHTEMISKIEEITKIYLKEIEIQKLEYEEQQQKYMIL